MKNKKQPTLDSLGYHLLNESRAATIYHLLSKNGTKWQSGFLTKKDEEYINKSSGSKVRCSCESGEYFYRLEL